MYPGVEDKIRPYFLDDIPVVPVKQDIYEEKYPIRYRLRDQKISLVKHWLMAMIVASVISLVFLPHGFSVFQTTPIELIKHKLQILEIAGGLSLLSLTISFLPVMILQVLLPVLKPVYFFMSTVSMVIILCGLIFMTFGPSRFVTQLMIVYLTSSLVYLVLFMRQENKLRIETDDSVTEY